MSNGWTRVGEIGTALAAGTIGVVAAAVARRLRTREPVGDAAERTGEAVELASATPGPGREMNPTVPTLPDVARVVAAFLAASASGFAAYTVLSVLTLRDIGLPFKPSFGDLIAVAAPYMLVVGGLALASVLVMAASRPDETGRDALNDAVDATVVLIAVAVIAVSGYSICSVLFGHHTASVSLFVGSNEAERLRSVGTSIAAALIGAAVVHLVVRGRQIVADRETEREIKALDLVA